MDPDKILQAHVGRTQISRVKIFAPWAKGTQSGGKKVHVFAAGTMKLFFFATEQISMKFGKKRQSVSSIEP